MTLKKKITIFVSAFFSLMLGLTFLVIYWKFAQIRRDEFKIMLEEKANTTVKILVELKINDSRLLRAFNRSTIHQLLNEKTLVFNGKKELIYSSLDDAVIKWSPSDLVALEKQGSLFRIQEQYELYGYYYKTNAQNYSVLVMAEDQNGKNKLQSLAYLFVFAFLVSSAAVSFTTHYIIRSLISPLDSFITKITLISDKNLTERLEESKQKDEINLLAHAFNQMMARIELAYKKQQEFSASASHELRTPLARMIAQLENLQQSEIHSNNTQEYLEKIKDNAVQLADLVHSLLWLAQVHSPDALQQDIRIDEALFDVIQQVSNLHPAVNIQFDFIENEHFQFLKLELKGNEALLKIAFSNLLKNAVKYGKGSWVKIAIEPLSAQQTVLRFMNDGDTLTPTEQASLFQAFMRGKNAQGKAGTGLGLRITHRILDFHRAEISYSTHEGINVFEIKF